MAAVEAPKSDMINECVVPLFNIQPTIELPECQEAEPMEVVKGHQNLFSTTLGVTTAAEHYIPTTGNPVKIPPHRIPAHFEIKLKNRSRQCWKMESLKKVVVLGWLRLYLFPKKSGDIRLCVDYRELNKKLSRMLIHYCFRVKYKTISPALNFSPRLIYRAVIGSFQ